MRYTATQFDLIKEQFSPLFYEFVWNQDYTSVLVVKCKWVDNKSYEEWQGDPENNV